MEIISKSILELTDIGSQVKLDSVLAIQRKGASSAEKIEVDNLGSYLLTTGKLKEGVATQVQNGVSTAILSHTKAVDPHGDRSYTDEKIRQHSSLGDPHGSNNYTNEQITKHSAALDPHKDREYSDSKLNSHIKTVDPHGDRAFTNTSIANHAKAIDPHGDRAFTTTSITNHTNSADPHKDRAYSDSKLTTHNANKDAHGILASIQAAILAHNNSSTSHDMDNRLKNIDTTISTTVSKTFSQQLGVTVPTLESGKIPAKYLKNELLIGNTNAIPSIGDSSVLYINKTTKSLSVWDNGTYLTLNSGGSEASATTTDYVSPGSRSDRQYFTAALKTQLDAKVATINSLGVGNTLYTTTKGPTLTLKTLKTEGNIELIDDTNGITLKTNSHVFNAKLNTDVELSTSSEIMQDISDNEMVILDGEVQAKSYELAGNKLLVQSVNTWKVKGVLGFSGTSEVITKPYNVAISMNGIVLSGMSVGNATVELYSAENSLVSSVTALQDGSFTIVLSSAALDGRKYKLYTVVDGNRSEVTEFYTVNRTKILEINSLTISKDGLNVRGVTSRNVNISIEGNTGTVLGTGTTDIYGNFDVKLSKALISNDTITITGTVAGTTITSIISDYVVALKDIEYPYNIKYTADRNYIYGYAEPNSLVTITNGSTSLKSSTDSTGLWKIYEFSNPITSSSLESIITVTNDAREGKISLLMSDNYVDASSNPVSNSKLLTAERKLLVNEVVDGIAMSTKLTFTLKYNPVTQALVLAGGNTSGKTVEWLGNFSITRTTIGDVA